MAPLIAAFERYFRATVFSARGAPRHAIPFHATLRFYLARRDIQDDTVNISTYVEVKYVLAVNFDLQVCSPMVNVRCIPRVRAADIGNAGSIFAIDQLIFWRHVTFEGCFAAKTSFKR